MANPKNHKDEKTNKKTEISNSKNNELLIENTASYISRGSRATEEEQQRKLQKHELNNLEAVLAYDFAIENKLWFADINEFGNPFPGGGNENELYYNDETGTIFKVNNLFNNELSISSFLKYIQYHNTLFETNAYTLIGFTGFSNNVHHIKGAIPYVAPIVAQKYVPNSENATLEDIQNYMELIGFEKVKDSEYKNREYIVSDLWERNVLKDKEGNIHIVDNMIKKTNTKKMSRGGKLVGASHAEGGIDIITPNGQIEAEGGEIIITKKASEEHCETLSKINQSGGGIAIPCDNNSKQPKKAANGAIIAELSGEHKDAMIMANKLLTSGTVEENAGIIVKEWRAHLLPHFKEEESQIYKVRMDEGSKHFIAEHKKIKQLVEKIAADPKQKDIDTFAEMLIHHINEEEEYFYKIDKPMKAKTGIKISSATTSELDKAVSDLHRVEKAQKMMKDANAIIRSKKNVQERLVKEAGFSEAEAEKIVKGDFRGRVGFSSYALTNNNANLKRLQDRVKMLQKKVEGAKAAETGGAEKYSFENGFFEVNYSADRVQIFFEGMPTSDQRNDLKRNGWHWSYTNKAWQRKITPQAIRNAEYLLKATKIVKTEVKPEETVAETPKFTKAVEISNDIKAFCEIQNLPIPERELANKGHTVYLAWPEEKIEAIIDAGSPVADGILLKKKSFMVENYKLSELREAMLKLKELFKKEETTETVLEPNTPEDFDEVVISNIDPHDGWLGNEIKERAIKKQIYDQLMGPVKERMSNAARIFKKYYDRTLLKEERVDLMSPEQRLAFKQMNQTGELAQAAGKTEPTFSNDDVFNGIGHEYKNQYELNKAIESFITKKGDSPSDYTSDEKNWIRKYSGYGGLDKYGTTGKGGLFEYYTPRDVIEKMWALAYKYGYNNGPVLEPSVATGEFLQFAKPETRVVGFEISIYSAVICKILYPTADIKHQAFEQHFIKNNWTMKDNLGSLEKFDLVIGNPPYGDFSIVASRYMTGMGEKDHTKAKNYVEYFIRRGLDLLNPKGLLIFIVGAQVKNGGTLFLDSGLTPVKEYLQKNCELLDAYRLPDSIFERTGVTSEIIVLQKN